MNKNIENIYLDFFEYYDTAKEKLDLIYDKCENVDCLFAGIIDNLRYYYDNKNDVILPDDLINYFEHEDFLNSIIHKIIIICIKNPSPCGEGANYLSNSLSIIWKFAL